MPNRFLCLSLASFTFVLICCSVTRAQSFTTNAAPISAPKTGAPTTPAEASAQMVADALKAMDENNPEASLRKLSEAIRLNPHNSGAYVLRASIYCKREQWNLAEQDFKIAQQIAPTNIALKFNIIEVKFMEKQYDAARPGYAALESDPDMGDFASYKVFLCDLAGGHAANARKELDAFNNTAGNPSYYFGNAAWNIFHKNFEEARSWLESASRVYPPRKNAYYAESLIYLGYLPLPKTTVDPAGG